MGGGDSRIISCSLSKLKIVNKTAVGYIGTCLVVGIFVNNAGFATSWRTYSIIRTPFGCGWNVGWGVEHQIVFVLTTTTASYLTTLTYLTTMIWMRGMCRAMRMIRRLDSYCWVGKYFINIIIMNDNLICSLKNFFFHIF